MGQKPSLEDEVANLKPPTFDDEIWMANCCKLNSMSRFAEQFCLYQPDCRLFCDKGMECKHLRLASGEAKAHLETFCHVSHDVLRAAAESDLQRRSTEVVNLPAIKVQVPYVSKCWVMPKDAKEFDTSSLSSFPSTLRGAQVVLLVHGFRFNGLRVLRTSWLLRQLTSTLPQSKATVVAFTWPSHRHHKSYTKARTDATAAAAYLAVLLRLLSALGCSVSVVAHSLGCRVALSALQLECLGEVDARVQYLALLGAAVSRDVLEVQGEFPRSRLLAKSVDIFYTHKDSVLSSYFKFGEGIHSLQSRDWESFGPPALGLRGPNSPDSLPDTTTFDVSEDVASHSAEQYLLASAFTSRLAVHMDPVDMPGNELNGVFRGVRKKLTEELLTSEASTEDSGVESE